VVINPSLHCGQCEFCIAGQDNLCTQWALLGETVRGTLAEYVAVPARNLYPLPAGFDEHQAAAAALVFQTAWHSLITRGGLHPGETVLVVGASGGVNTASIQIARLAGAKVYVVGSGAEKLELAASLGADVLIDRSKDENWSKAVFQLTNRRGVDVVVDNVGSTFPQSYRAARKGGRILDVGNTGGAKFEIDNRYIFAKHLSIIGSSMSTRQDFAQVMELVFAGKLKPVLDRTFPLSETRFAEEYLGSGKQMGKVTIEIGEE
jgi:NADPH:quinone reductase-like Zn-dependent oxidoreductase